MKQDEARLQKEIDELLAAAEVADASDDEPFGDRHGDELPEELTRRNTRLQKIRAAKAALEEQARQQAQAHVDQMEAEGRNHRTNPDDAVPNDKAQRNFTDPESKIMKTSNKDFEQRLRTKGSNKGFDQCGNAQIVATEEQVIVAADVTNQANDMRQIEPMVDQLQSNVRAAELNGKVKEFIADAGYFSEDNTQTITSAGMDPLIATQRLKHNEEIPACAKGRTPGSLSSKQRMARKLRTKKGRQTYAKRKWMVEPVFRQIKACRGFRQFLLRCLSKMQGEWTMVCLTHNLLKAFGAKSA